MINANNHTKWFLAVIMYRAADTNSPGPVGSKLLKGVEVSLLDGAKSKNQDSDHDGDQGDHQAVIRK